MLCLGRFHVAADLSRLGLGTSRLIAGRAPCGCLGGGGSGGSQGGGRNMAHLLHLKGVILGIVVFSCVGCGKKLKSALKNIWISGEEEFKGR